ncbi:MAG: response regulator [Nanoarchaeota archaeon]|nr:response regulator [Nanoarchaeota archaeon]
MPKKILVVDDEQTIQILLKAVLEKEGYSVIVAGSGQECLKKLETTKPDLVILDMMMPSMTGRETLLKIKKNPKTKNLKIIFLTVVHASQVGKEELKKNGVLEYITKPFNNAELVKKIKQIIN